MSHHLGYSDSVNLTISLCLTYILIISGVRAWIRKGAFGVDDVVIAIATVVTFGHTGADYAALIEGLGTPWTHVDNTAELARLNAASISGVVTFILALYLSKCAMVAFLGRITKTHSQVMLYYVCNGIVAAIGVVSLLIVTVDCPSGSGYYWAFHDNRLLSCPSQSTRWQALTAFDIITEVILLILPAHLIFGLQMPWRRKVMIIAAFYLRIPVIGFSIARNYYTFQLRLPQTDAGLTGGLVVIWLEIQLAYALAASTLSASKSFTESFNSGFGLGFARGKGDESYGLSDVSGKTLNSSKDGKSRNDSALESGASVSRARSLPRIGHVKDGVAVVELPANFSTQNNSTTDVPLKLRPETEVKTFTHVSAEPDLGPWQETSTAGSETSTDDMVILRETAYEVQHDRAPILGNQHT